MRVLMISPNRQTFVHPVPPIGMLYLAAVLRDKGHTVRALDLMFAPDPFAAITAAVAELDPQLVGLSIRNVDTLFSKTRFEIPDLERYARHLRTLTTVPLILGGAGYSLFPELLVERLEADYGIAGEADEAFPLFLDRLSSNGDLADVPGLVCHRAGRLVARPPHRVTDLDAIPFQAVDQIDYRQYGRRRGNMGVFTRKGCPQDCIYCPEAPLHGHTPRLRSAARVADEIEFIVDRTGVRYFDFADTLFNAPRSHAMDVCQTLVDRKIRIRFEVELNPVGQDEDSVRLLKAAGCMGVDLTADSGSDRMLDSLNKGYTAESVAEVARLYCKHGIPYTTGFILGGPGENRATLEETLAFARNRLPGVAGYYFAVGIRVFQGTALAARSRQDSGGKDAAGLDLSFYLSPELDAACMDRLIQAYHQDWRLYLCDLFYEEPLASSLRLADRMNVRPIWKAGRFPRLFEYVASGGRRNIRWDAHQRRLIDSEVARS